MIVYKITVYAITFLFDLCPAWGMKFASFQEEIMLSCMERVDDNHKITQIPSPSSCYLHSLFLTKMWRISRLLTFLVLLNGNGLVLVDLLDTYAFKLSTIASICPEIG